MWTVRLLLPRLLPKSAGALPRMPLPVGGGASLAQRHAVVLGLKAFVLSSPYDVPGQRHLSTLLGSFLPASRQASLAPPIGGCTAPASS